MSHGQTSLLATVLSSLMDAVKLLHDGCISLADSSSSSSLNLSLLSLLFISRLAKKKKKKQLSQPELCQSVSMESGKLLNPV